MIVTDHLFFAGGCRSLHREHAEGSVGRQVVRHDRTVPVDELVAERQP